MDKARLQHLPSSNRTGIWLGGLQHLMANAKWLMAYARLGQSHHQHVQIFALFLFHTRENERRNGGGKLGWKWLQHPSLIKVVDCVWGVPDTSPIEPCESASRSGPSGAGLWQPIVLEWV